MYKDYNKETVVGDVFRVDEFKMTVVFIDCESKIVLLKDDFGCYHEFSLEEINSYGKLVVTELPGYPITDMPHNKFYLVSCKDCPNNPGSTPYNLCRKGNENGILYAMGGGVYCGVTHYHPFKLTYPNQYL
jgi:hypothetical protein